MHYLTSVFLKTDNILCITVIVQNATAIWDDSTLMYKGIESLHMNFSERVWSSNKYKIFCVFYKWICLWDLLCFCTDNSDCCFCEHFMGQ